MAEKESGWAVKRESELPGWMFAAILFGLIPGLVAALAFVRLTDLVKDRATSLGDNPDVSLGFVVGLTVTLTYWVLLAVIYRSRKTTNAPADE